MGQGLYDLLGYGVLNPPSLDDDDPSHAALLWMIHGAHDFKTGYQTTPHYLVIPLAVSDPVLQEDWHLPPLPDWVPRVGRQQARVLTAPAAHTVPGDVQRPWCAMQCQYAALGLTLADGVLILANDWH